MMSFFKDEAISFNFASMVCSLAVFMERKVIHFSDADRNCTNVAVLAK